MRHDERSTIFPKRPKFEKKESNISNASPPWEFDNNIPVDGPFSCVEGLGKPRKLQDNRSNDLYNSSQCHQTGEDQREPLIDLYRAPFNLAEVQRLIATPDGTVDRLRLNGKRQ